MTENNTTLNDVLSRFTRCCTDPLLYLSNSENTSKGVIALTKDLFDFASGDSNKIFTKQCPIDELLVDGFNDEQIWQELQLRNKLLFEAGDEGIAKLLENENEIILNQNEDLAESKNREHSSFKAVSSVDFKESLEDTFEEDESLTGEDEDVELEDERAENRKLLHKKSVVDDEFFSLAQMEEFLNNEDRREEKRRAGELQENSDSDEESVDYFGNDEEDEDWDGPISETHKLLGRDQQLPEKDYDDPGKMMYDDFYDTPKTKTKTKAKPDQGRGKSRIVENEVLEDENSENDSFDNEENEDMAVMDTDDDNEEESDSVEKEENLEKATLSSFEKKEIKMKRKITELEEVNLQSKSWQLSGETSSAHRPINSILEEDLVFDHTTAPAPVITEETTKSLEDIIIQRIKDEAWDDVERKQRQVKEPYEYKKKQPLDQEKSKMSLGEIYEQDYIKQTQKENEEKEKEEHVHIKELMSKLFVKLDALSNFHFTPKPPVMDVNIVTNVSSISMEEVQPVSVSDSTLLAPHEVLDNKGAEEKGDTEKDKTDRLRERRKKKARQRWSQRERERRKQFIKMMKPGLGNKHSKINVLEKLKKDKNEQKNMTFLSEKDTDNTKINSSSAFFNKLQEKVTQRVQVEKSSVKEKKLKALSASRIKL